MKLCETIVPRKSSTAACCSREGQRSQTSGVRAMRHQPALGQVRRLLDPAAEGHAAPIRAIRKAPARCRRDPGDEGARPPSLPAAENPSPGAARRRSGGPRGSASSAAPRLSQVILRRADAEQAAVFLHHVDSGPAVACIDHQAHGAAGDSGHREARAGRGPGQAGDGALRCKRQVEGAPELLDALDRKLMEFEVLEIVLALKIARVAQAGLADVDRRDSGVGLAQRIPRRLRRAAAGDQDFLVCARLLGGPNQMELGPATVRIFIEARCSSRLVSGAG